jgi:hypothetical protein
MEETNCDSGVGITEDTLEDIIKTVLNSILEKAKIRKGLESNKHN